MKERVKSVNFFIYIYIYIYIYKDHLYKAILKFFFVYLTQKAAYSKYFMAISDFFILILEFFSLCLMCF